MKDIKLTIKQRRFCELYVETGNGTQSYIDARYKASSRKVAEANSRRLLANERVQEYIELLNKKILDESIANMVEVKQFWTRFIREANFEDKDRLKASELIAKTNGAFIDKVEHSGDINVLDKSKLIDKYLGDADE